MRCPYKTTYERNCQLSLPPVCVIIKGGEECRAYGSTMIRVKDPKASLDFYENVLGMELIDKLVGSDFTLYFLAYQHQKVSPLGKREAVLELTHNHGTENDPHFAYHNGNTEPRGFGHLAISVDNVEAACERFERLGVKWQKRLTGMLHIFSFGSTETDEPDGKMKTIGRSHGIFPITHTYPSLHS